MTFQERFAEGPEDAPAYTGPRVVCRGWEGVHTEVRVLSEGSEPVSHGMCADCERAVNARDAADYEHGRVGHERQGTSYDPDARGHELAGRNEKEL
jgi:hypothetical protein